MKRTRFIEDALQRLICAQSDRRLWLLQDEHARRIDENLRACLNGQSMLIAVQSEKTYFVRADTLDKALEQWDQRVEIDLMASVI
jgi:hypothetical protein